MSLKLILGESGSGKSYYLYNEMINNIEKDNRNYLYIVPEQFTMENQKKIVEMQGKITGRYGVMNVDILSFVRLAYKVFEEMGVSTLSVLDDMAKNLILRKVLEENKEALKVFKYRAGMIGFIEEIKSAISELYQYGISVDNLESVTNSIKGHDVTKQKLDDLMFVYKKFREYVSGMTDSKIKYITKEEVLEQLMLYVKDSDIIKNSYVVLDGYTGFTPVQLRLISMLLEYSKGVEVAVTIRTDNLKLTNVGFAEQIREQDLFKMSKNTINSLYALANDIRCVIEEPVFIDGLEGRLKGNEQLAFLEKNLFAYNNLKYDGTSDGSVQIYAAKSPVIEASFVVDKIRELMKKDNTLRYREIGIVTGDESLMLLIDRFLTQSDMPHFIDSKKSIMGNPFVEAIRAILEMADTSFSVESVIRYFRTYMTNMTIGDIDEFENYCLATGVKGRKKFSTAFAVKYKELKDEQLVKIEDNRKKYIEPLLELTEKMKKKTVREVTTLLYEFVAANGFKYKLEKYKEVFENNNQNSLASEYKQVYKLVMQLFDKLVMLMGNETIKMSEYRKILDAGFVEIKVGIIPMSVDQVMVGDIERTRLSDIKVLFIVGANDGIIPKHTLKGGIISQSDRLVLKEKQVELSRDAREAAFIQKFYMYLLLSKPSEKLFVSYSGIGSDGRAIRPSYLIENINSLYEKNICYEIGKYDVEEIYNENTIFTYLARNLAFYGNEEFDEKMIEVLAYITENEGLKKRLNNSIEGAFYRNNVDPLNKAVAKVIYENGMVNSATRLEKYAACAYSHFMEYGLKLAERRKYQLKAMDIGNAYHKCIEIFTEKLKQDNIDIFEITDNDRKKMIHECIEDVAKGYGRDVFFDSMRNKFILHKCEKVADKTAWALLEHMKRGGFKPEYVELSVESGRIDRVDSMEINGTKYMKIIDYKSGNTKFSTAEVFHGLKLQLMFYMDSLLEKEKKLNKGTDIKPAAVFYFNIQNPLVDYETKYDDKQAYETALLSNFTMTGFVNSKEEVLKSIDCDIMNSKYNSKIFKLSSKSADKELDLFENSGGATEAYFGEFIKRVKKTADGFISEILEGNIELNPYILGSKNPCKYCKYKEVCNFDERCFDNRYRRLSGNMEKIKKEILDGNELDRRSETGNNTEG